MNRMRTSFDRIRAIPGLRRDLFVVAALLGLGLLVGGYILSQQRIVFPWQDRIVFEAVFDEVPAISPGNGQEVRVAGVTVGEISDAEINDDGLAVLKLSIDPDATTIYEDATLELTPKSPLNEMYVNVTDVGSASAGEVTGGETLDNLAANRRPIPIDEVLAHLDENSREAAGVLLAELDTALAQAPETLPPGVVATDATLGHLQTLSQSLQTRRALLAELVTGLADVGTGLGNDDARLVSLVEHARTTLDAIAAQDDDLRTVLNQLPGLTDDLGTATASLVDLTGTLNPLLDDLRAASDELPDALAGLETTVDRLDRTVDLARPFLADARPVVADLRVAAQDLSPAGNLVRDITPMLDPVTAGVVEFLPYLQSFTYNTNSALSTRDAYGPILRGLLQVGPDTVLGQLPLGVGDAIKTLLNGG